MKYLQLKLITLLLAVTALSACDDNDCSATIEGRIPITAVSGPDTALVNQEITFSVSYKLYNDCATFKEFSQNSVYPRDIYANAEFKGCGKCNSTNNFQTGEYKFMASQAGEYELKFHNDENIITKTITVTAPE